MLIEDLTLLKCLGRGAFGEVYLTSKKGTQQKFATKKISKKLCKNSKYKKYFDNEMQILKEISHENIVKLYEKKETTNNYFLVMELCNGGSLTDCLEEYQNKNGKPFSEEIVQYLMKQIIGAIKYLHNKNIIHRDIKLDNILVNFDSEEDKKNRNMLKSKVKIIDFGFARHLSPEELTISIVGTPINMDPGILKMLSKKQKLEHFVKYEYDKKADIWSLGTICYEMLIGKSVFDSKSMTELIDKIKIGKYSMSKKFSKETFSFLNGMLKYDLKKRKTADQLYNHPFLIKPYNQLLKIEYNVKDDLDNDEIIELNINESNIIIDEPKPAFEPPLIKNEKDNKDKLFLEAFRDMNDDFIYIEPKLIPFIPGNDSEFFNKIS